MDITCGPTRPKLIEDTFVSEHRVESVDSGALTLERAISFVTEFSLMYIFFLFLPHFLFQPR
jgi:hypothetical protein